MKKAKDFIAGLLYKAILATVKLLPASKGDKHLLIIKLDEIGDYMLFRNMLRYFKESEKYKGYKITLLGNALWKPLFDSYDAKSVDNTIWLTKGKFNKSLSYRFDILKQVRMLRTSDVVNCIFSRSMILDDGFALVATGDNKVAMKGDNANRSKHAPNLDSSIYTQIIDAGGQRLFETIRNSNFINQLLNVNAARSVKMQLRGEAKYDLRDFFIISIGAGRPDRKWPLQNFIDCAEYVSSKYGLLPVISCGPADAPDAERFMQLYNKEAVNLAGKTTLPEFMELVGKAKFLLSVDSGPVHMAAAAGCPIVGLFSGTYYGRYAPYPKDVAYPFYAVYPDYVDALIAAKDEQLYDPFFIKNETTKIPADKVMRCIDALMSGA